MLQYVMISMQQMIQINIIHQILRSKVKRISKYGTQVHLSDANVIAHFCNN